MERSELVEKIRQELQKEPFDPSSEVIFDVKGGVVPSRHYCAYLIPKMLQVVLDNIDEVVEIDKIGEDDMPYIRLTKEFRKEA